MFHTQRWVGLVTMAVVATTLGACSDDSTTPASTPDTTAPDSAARDSAASPETADKTADKTADEARFAEPGPYDTGVTTLTGPDGRLVEVYYPAAPGHGATQRATYLQTDPIPAEMLAALPAPPADVDLVVEIPAYRDVPAADDGPFPLVVFSHGSGGWRGVQGNPLSHIAAWGFVVASMDVAEYGLIAQMTGAAAEGVVAPPSAVLSVIDLLGAQDAEPGSLLAGRVDVDRVAAAGHSRGGGTMFGLLDEPRIDTIVGWAPVPPTAPVTSTTPTLIIAGGRDTAVTPDEIDATYDLLQAPKRLVTVPTMGHNAFTDACEAIRSGTDLIAVAKTMGIGIPDRLVALGRNGCEEGDLEVADGWRIIEHFTVAHLRSVFGSDRADRAADGAADGAADASAEGLGDGVVEAFGDVEVTMVHTP